MQINEVIKVLEKLAPPAYQEDYDNSGLLTGQPGWECKGVITCLDVTEAVINEAVEKGCNLVVAHHPIIFKGLKKLTGKNYVERTLVSALKHDIAIYAIHTNLDNVKNGVNFRLAEKLGLTDLKILQPRGSRLQKLITFVPMEQAESLRSALFAAGGGTVGNYSECSFNSEGIGTFKAEAGSQPFIGEIGKRHEEKETRVEVIFPAYLQRRIIEAMQEAHPYEVAAYDILRLENSSADVGSGVIGVLDTPLSQVEFFNRVVSVFNIPVIRHTQALGKPFKKVAVCGGAGSFLLPNAIAAGADVFITSDIKYHEFFDAEENLVVADIGHYESEQFTIDLLFDILRQNFPNFAVLKTGVYTNPVSYFIPGSL